MFQIIYLSEVTLPVPEHRLERLIERSRAANHARGISSLLLRDGATLLHVIEGPREVVLELLERIKADRRHSGLKVLAAMPVMGREFDQVPLAYVDTATCKNLPPAYVELRPKLRARTITRQEAHRALDLFTTRSASLDHLAAIIVDNPGHARQPAP